MIRTALIRRTPDVATLKHVLSSRTARQRISIADKYQDLYGSDLSEDFNNSYQLSQEFRKLLMISVTPLSDIAAKYVRNNLESITSSNDQRNVKRLVHLICSSSSSELQDLSQAYKSNFNRSIAKDLDSDHLCGIGVILSSYFNRPSSPLPPYIDNKQAREDAATIRENRNSLKQLHSTRAKTQMRGIFEIYQYDYHDDIENYITSTFTDNDQFGLAMLTEIVKSEIRYCCTLLHDAESYLELLNIVILRCEIDMRQVKVSYKNLYGVSLAYDLEKKIEDDYVLEVILGWLGEVMSDVRKNQPQAVLYIPDSQKSPTMVDATEFNAPENAQMLRKAILKEDDYEPKDVTLLSHFSLKQRKLIEAQFKNKGGLIALIDQNPDTLKDGLDNLLKMLLKKWSELSFDALKEIFDYENSDKFSALDRVIEIIATPPTEEDMRQLQSLFKGNNLEKELVIFVEGFFSKKLIVHILNKRFFDTSREQESDVLKGAKRDARQVVDLHSSNDTQKIQNFVIEILTKRSPPHSRAIFDYVDRDLPDISGFSGFLKSHFQDPFDLRLLESYCKI